MTSLPRDGRRHKGVLSADDMARVEDFYARRGAKTRLTVSPWAHASLFEALAARGYRAVDFENILARRIAPDESFAPLPPGVAVTLDARAGGLGVS